MTGSQRLFSSVNVGPGLCSFALRMAKKFDRQAAGFPRRLSDQYVYVYTVPVRDFLTNRS